MDSIYNNTFEDLSEVKWAEKLPSEIISSVKRPAGLIIDMQDEFCRGMPYKLIRRVINSQHMVFNYLKENNLPLYVVKYTDSGDLVSPLNTIVDSYKHKLFEKKVNDAYYSKNKQGTLEEISKNDHVDSFIIMGLNATACVGDTTKSLLKNNHKVYTSLDLISDWCQHSTPENYIHWYGNNTFCFSNVHELLDAISFEDKQIN